MSLIYQILLNPTSGRNCWLQCRQFATIYTKTLNMPVTKFPTYIKKNKRADNDFYIREKHFKPLYEWQRKYLKGTEFVLHDGPPYANGDLHMGHAVNKITKDIILRTQIVNGNRVHYHPGWDCHGLPIEMKAKSVKDGMNALEIRSNARDFATANIKEQKRAFESWGVTANWNKVENMYRTYDPAYIKNQLNLFHQLYSKRIIFRDLKPVYWSPSSKTALAEAELEYSNQVSPSLYIRFKLKNVPTSLKKYDEYGGDVYGLIWTTTPWTLPANQAICFSPDLKYSVIRLNDEPAYYIVGTDLIANLKETLETFEFEECASVDAADLESCTYLHPIDKDTELPFLKGNHVRADIGTGLVHTAPSHGFDDYLVCLAENIPIKRVVDQQCKYNSDAPTFLQGKDIVRDGNHLCLEHVNEDVIQLGKITHSCPIDWRTKQPVIINVTHQWFIDIKAIRDTTLAQLKNIDIYTTSEKLKSKQLSQKIEQRPYWCISRQRVWGTPIPAFYRKDTGEVIVSETIVNHINELLTKNGTIDFWWSKDVVDLIPDNELKRLNLNADNIVKGNDILDIWFDSGISWSYALDSPNVADLYLEGIDQFTGWFQSSLITSVASRGISPFKSILVHGFTVDGNGRKMSKSLGNVINPSDILENHNVDTLRWWIAAHLVGQVPISVKPSLFDDSANSILKIRKVLKYLVGYAEKLESTDNQKLDINVKTLSPLDTYYLNSLAKFHEKIQIYAVNYRFPAYINEINRFINEFSALYINSIKDKMYINPPQVTKDTAHVLFAQFCILNKVLWPIIPHLVEEVWSYYSKTESFYKHQFTVPSEWHNSEFDVTMDIVKELFGMIMHNSVKNSVYYDTKIFGTAEQIQQLQKLHPSDDQAHNDSHLCEILQVQSIQLVESPSSKLYIEKTEIDKKLCDRCRRFAVASDETICKRCDNILKEMNFTP